jgi:hypothetical protein
MPPHEDLRLGGMLIAEKEKDIPQRIMHEPQIMTANTLLIMCAVVIYILGTRWTA